MEDSKVLKGTDRSRYSWFYPQDELSDIMNLPAEQRKKTWESTYPVLKDVERVGKIILTGTISKE